MFGKVAAFEFRYQLKNPVFWVAFGLFFLLTFGSVTVDQIQIGGKGAVNINAPFAIAITMLTLSVFFMFVSTAFVANVIVRDDETGFGPILRATRVRKFDYLFGRYAGAFAAAALAFTAVPLAMMIGATMPWLDAEKVGAFRLDHYAFAYFALALPALLVTSAAFFALATATRSMMATYVGVVGVLILWVVSRALTSKPELRALGAYTDPFGLAAFANATRYWTAADRNTLIPALSGELLWSRLLWVGVAVALLGLAYALFRFEVRGKKERREALQAATVQAPSVGFADSSPSRGERAENIPSPVQGEVAPAKPAAEEARLPSPRTFDRATAWAQFRARTRFDMGQVFKSPAFFVLMALGLFNAGAALWLADAPYGGSIHPVTRVMITQLRGAFSIIPMIVAIYYAGELVWRERDRKTEELIDSAPLPDWAFLVPKIAAVALVLLSMLLISVVAAMLIQTVKGYTAYEVGKYLWWYVAPNAVDFTLIAVLAVFLQTIVPHKFVGWMAMVVVLVAQLTLGNLGFEHNLYQFDGTPDVVLSDMNGQGRAALGAWWFRLYWSAISLALAVLAYALWRRGAQTALLPRLRRLPRRLTSPAGGLLAAALLTAVLSGAFIYQNTNVWNHYRTVKEGERWLADYEKTLLKYETLPQPKVTDVTLNVALYPERPEAVTNGLYVIQNKTDAPIRELHVRFDRELHVDALSVEGARPRKTYDRFNYRIFAFDTPMAPGERRRVSFTTRRGQRGFRNSRNEQRVNANGTFLNNAEISPMLGMSRDMLLTDRAKRRKYGLPSDLRPPKLEDQAARQFSLFRKDSDFVNADLTISTVADQTPIAPGYEVSDHVQDGRRTARFKSEAPMNHFFSIQSARYAIKRQTYKGVDLAVYYHPAHVWNVDRMIAALKVGLDYDQANFGSYQFRQVRIQEFPDYAQFAQSFANTIPYSEGIGFIYKQTDPAKIDMVTYVTAHELGHQWWGHQVVSSDQQGAAMPVETLAQYSALMAMEKLYGRDQIRRFLKFELDSYLRSRGSEAVEELPLERVENQGYIHYRKGSLVMYRLKEEIGEQAVNRALRRVIAQFGLKGAPYPRSKEVVDALRAEAPADKQALITDLFEKITLYDLKAKGATAKKRPDGKWDVTLKVEASKAYADGKGRETKSPLNETFDVGLFAREPGKKDFGVKDVIVMQRVPIHTGAQTVSFVADREPQFAGVDPYTFAIDRNSDDNLVKVGR